MLPIAGAIAEHRECFAQVGEPGYCAVIQIGKGRGPGGGTG
jgi:hypothetical protein